MWHVICDMWHVTHDTWHVTCDTWHVTRDMWHVWGGWTFSQNFSSLALTVCDLWYYEDLEEKVHGLTDWINDEAVYRTAPATPGLLNTAVFVTIDLFISKYFFWQYESRAQHINVKSHCGGRASSPTLPQMSTRRMTSTPRLASSALCTWQSPLDIGLKLHSVHFAVKFKLLKWFAESPLFQIHIKDWPCLLKWAL